MITDVAQAIMTKFNETPGGDALRTALTGGLWFTQAKPNVAFPYGVFTWDGSSVEELCGGRSNAIETAVVSVEIFSKNDDGGAEIFDIVEKFMLLFDWSTLSFPGGSSYSQIAMRRMSIVNRGKLDSIWIMELTYDVIYSH